MYDICSQFAASAQFDHAHICLSLQGLYDIVQYDSAQALSVGIFLNFEPFEYVDERGLSPDKFERLDIGITAI